MNSYYNSNSVMEQEYYEITSQLDAREVLRYLNHLGIHNISGEVLKYFITDLKKLIKYDLQQKYKKIEEENDKPGPERLHSATTFCSRIRSKTHSNEKVVCNRQFDKFPKPLRMRNVHSAPLLSHQKLLDNEPVKRCSCKAAEKKSEATVKDTRSVATGLSNNLIKVPRPVVRKKSDPVSLYHYYTSLWAKYKPNVPGENDWADLRWQIRQKMVGLTPKLSENKISCQIPKLQLKGIDSASSNK